MNTVYGENSYLKECGLVRTSLSLPELDINNLDKIRKMNDDTLLSGDEHNEDKIDTMLGSNNH